MIDEFGITTEDQLEMPARKANKEAVQQTKVLKMEKTAKPAGQESDILNRIQKRAVPIPAPTDIDSIIK